MTEQEQHNSDSGAAEDTKPTASSTDRSGSPGASTFGFETILGKLVVDSGFVTQKELNECSALLQDAEGNATGHTLGDVLVNHNYVTRRQLDRLQIDFDTRKSTQRIEGYRIIRKLGAGAMATVFLAQQESLDRPVAIKVLPKKFSENEDFLERFYKEGRAAAKLNDANIVQAYDVGKSGEYHYFVMEYVDGDTVYEQIVEKKKLSEKEALPIIRQVANALKHAHEVGFIHRDIKPKNIMIAKNGVVKLADLGLARALDDRDAAEAEAGRAYGTPYYISPEQIRGKKNITPAADIYGLGATLYHMVTGKVPFSGKNPSDVMHRHLKQELVPPDHINPSLSAGFSQVIEMMMAKDVSQRYQNATDLIEDLDAVASGRSPQFAQPTLDFAKLAEVVKATSTNEPVQQSSTGPASEISSMYLPMLIVSGLLNIILLIWVITK
ncbi:MAG TPA: serine/threonine protein kinase [Phycisphaerales bacterium]|nr:serine/threonine protein kinase [Phycisphaerales bacterium]HIB50686.1 serine/threonine protein kinase [Phycisphaerales bacterium]HIN83711.1 serine/threonine protein kinase [Phycisphaerales bacterium]HIO20201.1 serine/threonine protein kinase [Phycisphaerales bacterium]HIO52834.1 serine/threonine protein kinase [Phycisphaerales bacterium]